MIIVFDKIYKKLNSFLAIKFFHTYRINNDLTLLTCM